MAKRIEAVYDNTEGLSKEEVIRKIGRPVGESILDREVIMFRHTIGLSYKCFPGYSVPHMIDEVLEDVFHLGWTDKLINIDIDNI